MAKQITNLELLTLFRQCSHFQYHRTSRFHGQGRILILLAEHGQMTQRELMEVTQRRAATLSEQLEGMEKAGLLLRQKSAADKRTVDLFLTELGQSAARAAEKERSKTADLLFSVLDSEEKAQMHHLLEKLYGTWRGQDEVGNMDGKTESEDIP